jgi:hypothetical protein
MRSVKAVDNLGCYSSRLQEEFSCFKNAWEDKQIELPTKRDLEKKSAQMSKLMSQSMTNVCAVSARGLFSCSTMNRRTILRPCFGWRDGFKATLAGRMSTGRVWREEGLSTHARGHGAKGKLRPPDRLPAEPSCDNGVTLKIDPVRSLVHDHLWYLVGICSIAAALVLYLRNCSAKC